MNPQNIRFRARSIDTDEIVEGFYCRHDYGANLFGGNEPPFSTHDIWRNSPKGWVRINPDTLEIIELNPMPIQKSLFDI